MPTIGKIKLTTDQPHIPPVAPNLVLCNNIILPWEFNPHNIRLFVIGNVNGALGAVWAESAQDALDKLVDEGLGNALIVPEKGAPADAPRLGNAGETADLTGVWINEVSIMRMDPLDAIKLIAFFAEARGAQCDVLSDLE
jgi:hypothetical protein